MPNLSVKAGANNSADILIYDVIGPEWMDYVSAESIAKALKDLAGIEQINVRINSPGGLVFEGLAIYNLLKNHAAKVVVDIDGAAISIASIVAMAGDQIRMAKNAMFMIHDPWVYAMGNSTELRKEAETLDMLKNSLVDIYAARTGKDVKELAKLMSEETWMQSDTALEAKFVDEVTENKSVMAASGVDLSQFKNAPSWAKAALPPASKNNSPWRVQNARRRLEQMRRTA